VDHYGVPFADEHDVKVNTLTILKPTIWKQIDDPAGQTGASADKNRRPPKRYTTSVRKDYLDES
jgi:hypothetical protein